MINTSVAQYRLRVRAADKDSSFVAGIQGVQYSFKNQKECVEYINKLTGLLITKGFATASLDTIAYGAEEAVAVVFFGKVYKIERISTDSVGRKLLEQLGWKEADYSKGSLNLRQLQAMQSKILDYLENNGHPFAKVQLDSLRINDEKFSAALKVWKGPLYKIDSIRVFGEANITAAFLQHYLDIPEGSIYQKEKLRNIRQKLLELPYVEEVQPWDLTMLGTGGVLNVYLKSRQSSQINALIGLISPDDGSQRTRLRLTGEATVQLRNAFGNGEQIGLNWQQLQVKSPRLDLSFSQPYIFGTSFGISASFNLFKKDSSFVNLGVLLGAQYAWNATQSGKLFIQQLSTNLLDVDTVRIKNARTLPDERDVSSVSLGVDYSFNKVDYRLNPRRGWELNLVASAGTRKVRKNNIITKLQSGDGFNYEGLYDSVQLSSYQFRIKLYGARYVQLGRASTIKAALNAAWLQSPEVYRNELFQIGGYRLLRGFDEESIYASRYATGTIEYRYLIGLNSYLFTFIDMGTVVNKSLGADYGNSFLGTGIGLAFETKAGMFNISYAIGKRNDETLNLRQAKIHLGYVSYF